MPYLSASTKAVAIFSLIFFLCALSAILLASYLVDARSAAYASATAARAAQEREYKQMSSIVALTQTSKGDREQLETYVLSDEGVIAFLTHLESVGKKMGLTVDTSHVDTEDIGRDKVFESLSIELNAKGSRASLESFSSYIEGLPYQVTINELTFSQAGQETSDWSLTLKAHITKLKPTHE